LEDEVKKGSERYKALLDEALQLHLAKNAGYGGDSSDAWSNFRLAEGMGLTPVQGVLVRLGDKFARVQNLAANPENDKVGESMRDSLMDLSAYALIAICLMEEDNEPGPSMDVDEFLATLDGGTAEPPSGNYPTLDECCIFPCDTCVEGCASCIPGCYHTWEPC
jgi:hypothetical protein